MSSSDRDTYKPDTRFRIASAANIARLEASGIAPEDVDLLSKLATFDQFLSSIPADAYLPSEEDAVKHRKIASRIPLEISDKDPSRGILDDAHELNLSMAIYLNRGKVSVQVEKAADQYTLLITPQETN